jgi:hypothetical protein
VNTSSFTQGRYIVQGLEVFAHRLTASVDSYFQSLYPGETPLRAEPLHFELDIVEQPPPVPADSERVIKGPTVTYHTNGKEIHFVSKDGSIICFDPVKKKATGSLKKEILQKTVELCHLMSAWISEALRYHGFHFLHSAALYGDEMGCLVSGESGSGKTTAAVTMVREGFKCVSDDSLFFREYRGEIIVLPVFKNRNFHIDQDLTNRFPELSKEIGSKILNGTKKAVDVSTIFPDFFIPYVRPHAIIFPKITLHQKSILSPLPQVEVFRRLLKQTIPAVDNDISRGQLRTMQLLVRQARGFELLSGRDIYENPNRFVSLLAKVSAGHENSKKNQD